MPFTEPPPTSLRRGGRKSLLVDDHLAAMTEQERAGAIAWLHSAASERHLSDKFTAEGYFTSVQAIRNWRRDNPA